MVKFIMNRPDKPQQTWNLTGQETKETLQDIVNIYKHFDKIDTIEFTFKEFDKVKSNSKVYAFPEELK